MRPFAFPFNMTILSYPQHPKMNIEARRQLTAEVEKKKC